MGFLSRRKVQPLWIYPLVMINVIFIQSLWIFAVTVAVIASFYERAHPEGPRVLTYYAWGLAALALVQVLWSRGSGGLVIWHGPPVGG